MNKAPGGTRLAIVNMVTKSGGDIFSGSFRTSFTNDAWRALTPFPGDQVVASITPTYEATGGGPIVRQKVWFFGAWRYAGRRSRRVPVERIAIPAATDARSDTTHGSKTDTVGLG
jgi:hypothetical protein